MCSPATRAVRASLSVAAMDSSPPLQTSTVWERPPSRARRLTEEEEEEEERQKKKGTFFQMPSQL